jgi:peroxiredoxin
VRIAARLAGIELKDSDGERWRLGDLWQKRPVVLVFIRHFG